MQRPTISFEVVKKVSSFDYAKNEKVTNIELQKIGQAEKQAIQASDVFLLFHMLSIAYYIKKMKISINLFFTQSLKIQISLSFYKSMGMILKYFKMGNNGCCWNSL